MKMRGGLTNTVRDIQPVEEFFGFGKNKDKKQKDNKVSDEDKKIIDYLEKNYANKIVDIIELEYNKNKAKWDKLAYDLSKKAAAKDKDYNYEEIDYAAFNVKIDRNFHKHKEFYYLNGEFFDADQMLGFEVENELEKKFFSAIEPKIKKLCGSLFVKIEGDPGDFPGVLSVILKCDESVLKESYEESADNYVTENEDE